MVLDVHPKLAVQFHEPFTEGRLVLTNTGPLPILYKIKTTAPKFYAVRPNGGRIEGYQSITTTIFLSVGKVNPYPGLKCRDKFLIQSVALEPEEVNSPADLLNAPDEYRRFVDSDRLSQTKLRVSFNEEEVPDGADDLATLLERQFSNLDGSDTVTTSHVFSSYSFPPDAPSGPSPRQTSSGREEFHSFSSPLSDDATNAPLLEGSYNDLIAAPQAQPVQEIDEPRAPTQNRVGLSILKKEVPLWSLGVVAVGTFVLNFILFSVDNNLFSAFFRFLQYGLPLWQVCVIAFSVYFVASGTAHQLPYSR